MIIYLKHYFNPSIIDKEYSLAINGGEGSSRLTHNHEKQFYYVLQSLQLWKEITFDMFKLFYLSEIDLLDVNYPYEFKDTGQGFQRVQVSNRIFHTMQTILFSSQKKLSTDKNSLNWIGSSVIHLGDNNVPNALIFIDKYTQVSRILAPIVTCLEMIDRYVKDDENIRNWINNYFGGQEKCLINK